MWELYPHQQESVDTTVNYVKKSFDPCLLELATGAGKSLIVAEIAKAIKEMSGKKILCLAPSKELVEQNRGKYLELGEPASMFSASTGSKCLAHDVVFGSPQTVLNSIDKLGNRFSAVIIDEAHGLTPTIKSIIYQLKELNPRLRVIGLTATPYRMGSGYIYRVDEDGKPVADDETNDPFFHKLLYKVTAPYLIEQGYLTQPVADTAEGYDTEALEMRGKTFSHESMAKVFEGQERKTAEIVRQVVALSDKKMGVMFFASTIQHAEEIIRSLPDDSRIVTGKTKKKERELIINQFKARSFKYLVNVSVLTTGFDAPHVDVIAILRATESASLFQQIIGRGLRLHPEKDTCLILDYAENIERHELEDNLFEPKIKALGSGGEKFHIEATCPICKIMNTFSGRPNKEEYPVDDNGYFLDLAGDRVLEKEQPLPAHFGRRCNGFQLVKGEHMQCDYRWSHKACPDEECNAENDIAARYCTECKGELIDPNEKLQLEYKRMKTSVRVRSTDAVRAWFPQNWNSQKGNTLLRVDYTNDYRTFSVWYSPDSRAIDGQALWADLCMAVFGKVAPSVELFIKALQRGHGKMPTTVTCRKEGDFFRVFAHNQPEDDKPDEIS